MDKDFKLIEIEKLHDNRFTILETDYTNMNRLVRYKCNVCGYIGESRLTTLKYNGSCKNCNRLKNRIKQLDEFIKISLTKIKEICEKRNYTFINFIQEGKKLKWYVEFINNNTDRNGNIYGASKQIYTEFLKNKPTKAEHSDNVALSTDDWIKKAKEVHPEYVYDKVNYINCHKSIIVTCPKHGDFSVVPKEFIKPKYKCFKCTKEEKGLSKSTTFIERAKVIHNNKYDYSKVEPFNDYKKNIIIICPEHGEFKQSPNAHLMGRGCPKCRMKKSWDIRGRKTTEEWIKEARAVHGDKYDYSKVEYINNDTKVHIICPEHGEFLQRPKDHLNGQGCPKCSKRFSDLEYFIERANKIYSNKYDYSNFIYANTSTKGIIICHEKDEFGEEHGEFLQTPKIHLRGFGCSKCSNNYMDKNLFIKKSNVIHENKYDYSKTEYEKNNKKVCIICPEHGEFWQRPNDHLQGQGCPLCKTSHIERKVRTYFNGSDIELIPQKHFDWLGRQSLDFFIEDKNIGIECQSEIHYVANYYKNKGIEDSEKRLEYRRQLDATKKELCKEHGIKLVYFLDKQWVKYLNEDDTYFTDLKELENYIKIQPNI